MSNPFKLILSVLSVFLLASAVALGQGTTGKIEGTIKDSKGAVVPGATVTISGQTAGFNQTAVSNDQGVFHFERVPVGKYKITVGAISGFAETSIDATVVIEKTTTADITLGISTSVNTVEVVADPLGVVVDTTDSKVQTNITSELIDKIPTGTSFTSVLKVSPGTRSEALTGGFTVDGASKAENTFVLDGQETTSYRYGTLPANQNIPTALVKEVQIKNSGFEAEHGGASGAVVSVVTKSGTDSFHGEFGSQFTPSGAQPKNRFVPTLYRSSTYAVGSWYAIQQPKDDSNEFDPTFSLGGPVIKKRLWFYGIYSPQRFNLTRVVNYYNSFTAATGPVLIPNPSQPSGEVYKYNERYEYAQGRLDYSITNNLNGFTSFLWNPHIVEGSLPNSAISVGGRSPVAQPGLTETGAALARLKGGRENSNVFTTQMTWTPKSWFVLTGRFGNGFLNSALSSYGRVAANAAAAWSNPRYICYNDTGDPNYPTISGCPVTNAAVTSYDTGVNLAEVSKRRTFNIDASFVFNGLGSHVLKTGYEYAKLSNEIIGIPTVRVYYYFGDDPADYGLSCPDPTGCVGVGEMLTYGENGKAANKAQALYVQDKWQIHRLTLNLGVRSENEDLPAFNTASGGIGIPIKIPWGRKTVPRLGAAYDLFGDGKTRIYGSYGIFSDHFKFEMPIGSFGGAFYTDDYFPVLASNPTYTYYTPQRIWGNWYNFTDPNPPHGGGDPSTAGGLSQFEVDYRIPSNVSQQWFQDHLGFPLIGVDPKLKPFEQDEFTVGYESELPWRDLVLGARYTRKSVLHAVEDIGTEDNNFNEYYTIGNPGEGVGAAQATQFGVASQVKPKRLYNALEIDLTKRFSHNYFFSMNYTLSRLEGNYSGLANSDYWDGGSSDGSRADRASPGVNRFWDYPVSGYTINGTVDDGPLATDRTHVFKAYGGYTFDWFRSKVNSTDISFFTTIESGTPQTTVVQLSYAGRPGNLTPSTSTGLGVYLPLTKRGDLGRTPTFTQTDLSLSHSYRFGRDGRFKIIGDITMMNAFNENNVVALNPTKYINNLVPIGMLVPTPDFSTNYSYFYQYMNAILAGKFATQASTIGGTSYTAQTYLDRANNHNIVYGAPSAYQAKRNIRFGFRFVF